MAKFRHRIFEMFDYRDEAIHELSPKSVSDSAARDQPLELVLNHLSVSRSGGVTELGFKGIHPCGTENVALLVADLAQLANQLERGGKVLVNFKNVPLVDVGFIDALAQLKQKLRTRGSRVAICCLEPTARESFFTDS
jgi:hypothetical protein